MFQSPGDILFSIHGFPIYNYGLTMAFACIIGVSVAYLLFKKYYSDKNYSELWDISAYLIIAGIVGARLYYCLLNPVYYSANPLEILNFRQGGLSIHGGLIAGILTLILLSKKKGLPIFGVLDSFACGTALGQAIGRWGNFFNSEAYGYPTDLPWKLFIPASHRYPEFINFKYYHPTFLYESLLDLCIFAVLCFVMKKYANLKPGVTLFVYLALYSVVRIFVEHFRIDSALDFYCVPIAQIISLLILIFSICALIYLSKKVNTCKGNHS